jgi:hypothetical protein
MTNAVIVQEKLHVREKDWQVFLRLCERLQVRIPTREELGQVQP